MPNVFKYNPSSTEAKSLRKGNFYIGAGDVAKGPTNETGFWNGVTVGTFSYVIVLHRGENVPTFYQIQDDEELILRTNQIDKSTVRTTKEQCFSYFAGQSDKMIVNKDYDTIVTDGLVLNLDAGFLASFPATGSSWYDLSGNENHVTLYNTPLYFDGTLSGDGSNSYGRTTNTLNLSGLSSITVISIWKQTTSTTGGMVYEHTANWNNNNNYSGVSYGGFGLYSNSNGTVTSENLNHHQLRGNVGYSGRNVMSPDTSNFQQYTTIHDFTGGINLETKVYINGNFVTGSSAGGNNNTSTFGDDYLYLWSRGGVSFSPNSLSLIMIYNKSLSDQEVLQNYYLCNIQTTNLSFLVDPRNVVSNETSTTITDLTSNKFIFNYEETVEKSGSFGGTLRLNSGRLYRNVVSWYGNYTFGFWFKNQGSIQSALFYTESNRGPSGCARVYSIMQSNGTFRYRVWDNSSVTPLGSGQRQVDTITNVQDGNWHFVTCVWSNGNSNRNRGLYVFVNGVLEATTDIIGNDGSYASLHIGGASGCIGTASWNCYLGPFMQYSNLAMNDIQVMNLYESYRSRYR